MAASVSAGIRDRRASQPTVVPVDTLREPVFRDLLRVIPGRNRLLHVAWAMLAISLVCALAMIALIVYAFARDGFSVNLIDTFIWGPLFILTVATGVLIVHQYPRHRVGWTVLVAGFVILVAHVPFFYGVFAITRPHWDLPNGPQVMQFGFLYPFTLFLLLVEVPLIFPTGKVSAPIWQLARIVGLYGAACASWLWGFGSPYVEFGAFGEVANPWFRESRITGLADWINPFDLIFWMGVPALFAMALRLRRATGVERMQMRWIAWVAVIVVSGYCLHISVKNEWLAAIIPKNWLWMYSFYWGLCLNAIGIVVGIAILKYRLYDIDIVIHRSLLYAALVALVAIAYVAAASLANLIVGGIEPESPRLWVTAIAVAAVVALLVHPLRVRVNRVLNRWLFGSRDDPDDTLARLGAQLELASAPSDLLSEVAGAIRDLLRLPHAAVVLEQGDGFEVVAESGIPGAEQAAVPLIYHQDRVGELRVTPRSPGEGFSRADQRVLERIARQTAAATYALRVTDDLQLARERLVTTREEERRRLRRDLHDGLGAQLAALTIQTGSIRKMLRTDPDRAERELDAIQGEMRGAIADIRRIVHGMRPPALDEFGLVAALRSRMQRFEGEDGITNAQLDLVGSERTLPAALEVAIYRIVEEALTNANRHGLARSVHVQLELGNPVRLIINDDGIGLPLHVEHGVGIRSMRERAEELGGEFEITSASSGGTRIVVEIPDLSEAVR